jgi:hypothetical protein
VNKPQALRALTALIALLVASAVAGLAYRHYFASPSSSSNTATEVASLSPTQALADPNRHLNQSITLTGRLHFEITCHDDGSCTSQGYLVSSDKTWQPTGSLDQIKLYESGQPVGCPSQSQLPTCGDWVHQDSYKAAGSLKYPETQTSGSDLIFEVTSKQLASK